MWSYLAVHLIHRVPSNELKSTSHDPNTLNNDISPFALKIKSIWEYSTRNKTSKNR